LPVRLVLGKTGPRCCAYFGGETDLKIGHYKSGVAGLTIEKCRRADI